MRLARTLILANLAQGISSLLRHLVVRLIEADARSRQARRLEDLPDELLRDMGLKSRATTGWPQPHRDPWD